MTLKQELAQKKAKSATTIPQDKYAVMQKSTQALLEAKISDKALKTGDTLPEFELPDEHQNPVGLDEIHIGKYLIISFYRGGWCPYCNMELRALQKHADVLGQLGANLVAISPETPDNSLTTLEKNQLQFKILSDKDNHYAKKLNLTFQMPENLKEVYHSFGIHVDHHNGNSDFELPMPATYIIDTNRTVIYHFVPEDYTQRMDPEEIVAFLRNR